MVLCGSGRRELKELALAPTKISKRARQKKASPAHLAAGAGLAKTACAKGGTFDTRKGAMQFSFRDRIDKLLKASQSAMFPFRSINSSIGQGVKP